MPKLKSNRGAAKRFRKTANGWKFRRALRGHNFTCKTHKRKRQLRANGMVDSSDSHRIDQMLPFAG
jgi:large subunit ribosomal protein L35